MRATLGAGSGGAERAGDLGRRAEARRSAAEATVGRGDRGSEATEPWAGGNRGSEATVGPRQPWVVRRRLKGWRRM
ncbi:hypothetical protein GCM10010222_72980 [Streptomyces tanashiensis]|nr:hypothetical protein GCM10010222_72980 [Streptomyces tanashiensis]